MQENPESKEKKIAQGNFFEAPGSPIPEAKQTSSIKAEEKIGEKESRGEMKADIITDTKSDTNSNMKSNSDMKSDTKLDTKSDAEFEKKEPKESDFVPPGQVEPGYSEKSWEKPQDMEPKETIADPAFQEKKEPKESDFKAPGEVETGYTKESWSKPGDMGAKGTGEETRTEGMKGPEGEKKEGSREETGTVYTMSKKLTRSKSNRMIFGVCGGLGNYLGIDPTFIRLGFAAFVLLTNIVGVAIYILLAVIMPPEGNVEMVPSTKN